MTEPAPATKRRGLSTFLWISGAVLWLMVGLMLYANHRREAAEGESAVDPSAPVTTVSTDSGIGASGAAPSGRRGKDIQAGGLVEPAAMWSEEGIGDFSLTERSGTTVTKQDLLGKPWIVGFVFTRCAGPCPRVTGQMRKLQDQLKDEEFRLVTMTVDPDYDTPEVLTRYADLFGADETKWLFVTGEKETMYRYIEEHFRMPVEETQGEERKPGFEVIHTTNLLLVDSKGVVRGKYNAVDPEEMEKLKRELKALNPESKPADAPA
jgi:protein SCO1